MAFFLYMGVNMLRKENEIILDSLSSDIKDYNLSGKLFKLMNVAT